MDYQLTQTGAQVQEILNDAPITQQDLEAVEALIPEGAATGNKLVDYNQMNTLLQAKQDKLTEQTTGTKVGDLSVKYGVNIGYGVTVGSDNQTKVTITPGSITKGTGTNIFDALATIEAVIPSAASGQNKLTDKNYVDGAIATSTANFVGTFDSLAELQAVQNPTNNDYGFVIETDAQGNEYYDRYKFNGTQWLFEYKVESTPFTADQWAAIQSGITSALVTKLNALPTAQQLNTALNGKQDTIADLATIRSGAAAGATAVQPAALQSGLATKQDTITDLAAIRSGAAAGATAAANTGDKAYDAAAFSGLGRKNLPKNIVEVSGIDKNVLTQAMINTANTIYVIQYDYDLNGQTITLPTGSILQFDGGSVKNGSVDANGGVISGDADLRVPVSNVGNSKIEMGWFAKGADASTALSRAMACANSSECGIVDGGNKEYTLLSSIAVDKDNQCRLENLNLKFTASADGQSMFLFDEATRYAGNVLSFRNCTFEQTNPNDYQNVHCIHLRRFDSTNKGKVESVNVKNFSGYMFICESYLQEAEFNLFKGQYVGGFISFNKEYGTANAFGDYGQGSSNILNIVNCGIDHGLSVNNTITDIVDLSNNICATLTNCVWQGAAQSKSNFNCVNVSAYDTYRVTIKFINCWTEFVNTGAGYYSVQLGGTLAVFFDRLQRTHIIAPGVFLETNTFATLDFSNTLIIEDGTWPNIKFIGAALLWELERKIHEAGLDEKANIYFDGADYQNGKILNVYRQRGIVKDMLMSLMQGNSSSKKSLIIEDGLPIVRQLPPDTGYNWTLIATLPSGQGVIEGKFYTYRLVFRVFPLETPSSETVNDFWSDISNLPYDEYILVSSRKTKYCSVGQSTEPADAEWNDIIVCCPFLEPADSLRIIKNSSMNVGIDIAVCELWEGRIPVIKDIEIDPTDATKLIKNRDVKVLASAETPINPSTGFRYFNTAVNKILVWNGTKWTDAVGGDASASTPPVVNKADASSFTAIVDTTYNISAAASSLLVTLPSASNEKVHHVRVIVSTAAASGIGFVGASGVGVYFDSEYKIESGKTYLCECFWNGASWWVKASEMMQPTIPANLKRLQYIQNTGDAWIDTGIAGAPMTWTLDAQSTVTSGNHVQRLLTGRDTGQMMYGCGWNRYWGAGAGTTEKTSFNVNTRKTGVITFAMQNCSGTVDGETFAGTGYLVSSYTFKLFNNSAAATTREPFFGYLWSAIAENDGTILFNGIPCVDENNIAGLYDTVSKTFFPSIGTDQFVAGPDYVEPTE